MNPQAQIAITAARNFHTWGRFAALRYVQKRGCPERLYYLARLLEAAQGV